MKKVIQFRTGNCSNLFPPVIVFGLLIIAGCSGSKEHRPSPFRTDSTSIFGVNMKIEYSSPGVKGRKIFGIGDDYLEQYGEVWRTGANEATVFATSEDILIDGRRLAKGKFALFTVPGPKTWEVIFNEEWNQWGSYYRKEDLDVLHFTIPAETLTESQEKMTFTFTEEALNFRWEYVSWSLPITPI